MKDKRLILYMALAFVGMMLWSKWSAEHAPTPKDQVASLAKTAPTSSDLPPQSAMSGTTAAEGQSVVPVVNKDETPASRIVTVQTDTLIVHIDRKGGNIIDARLKHYPAALNEKDTPMQILSSDPSKLYVAQSGLMGARGPDTQKGQVTYQSKQSQYQLKQGEKDLTVNLTWSQDGVKATKSFVFTPSKYSFNVNYTLVNASAKVWNGHQYSQIRNVSGVTKSSMLGMNTYQGAAISTPSKPYYKVTYKDMAKSNLDVSAKGGWVAMQQRYFVTAWVPEQSQSNHYYSHKAGDVYTIGYVGPEQTITPGSSKTISSTFYVGPELQKDLEALAPHLGLTIDYGWLWWASGPIFWVMQHIFNIIGNWGWSIIIVTLLIKLAFYKLSESSYRSMAKMKQLQPKMAQLKERFKDDKTKLNKAMMELYQREKLNPLGGCLPMVIQIPVFIALYYVLIESVQLRHAPFMLWIQDLSAKDPYYILPILMGGSMLLQQMMNPSQMDKTQEMMMKFGLPILFTVLFMNFPSGLVLYWLVNNVLSIAQQELVMRRVQGKGKKPAKKKVVPSNDSAIK